MRNLLAALLVLVVVSPAFASNTLDIGLGTLRLELNELGDPTTGSPAAPAGYKSLRLHIDLHFTTLASIQNMLFTGLGGVNQNTSAFLGDPAPNFQRETNTATQDTIFSTTFLLTDSHWSDYFTTQVFAPGYNDPDTTPSGELGESHMSLFGGAPAPGPSSATDSELIIQLVVDAGVVFEGEAAIGSDPNNQAVNSFGFDAPLFLTWDAQMNPVISGVIPEPSTVALLVIGSFLMVPALIRRIKK